MKNFTVMYHPRSGDAYAVELDDKWTIIRAAGPMPHTEPRDIDTLINWLDNADMSEEDGAWLEEEFNKS